MTDDRKVVSGLLLQQHQQKQLHFALLRTIPPYITNALEETCMMRRRHNNINVIELSFRDRRIKSSFIALLLVGSVRVRQDRPKQCCQLPR